MIDDDSKEFKFDDDNEEFSDSLYQEEIKDLRVEKLTQRVTIITILIPCLIGVILYVAYRDLTGRVTKSEYSGSKVVENLSKELEEKFKTLSARYSDHQASMTAKISAIEKATTGLVENLDRLKDNLNNTEETLKSIAASKVDKNDQADALKKINDSFIPIRKELEALAPVRKELDAVSSGIQALDQNLSQKWSSLSATLTSLSANVVKTTDDLSRVQSSLATMSDQQIDKNAVELEILKARKIYERTLDQEIIKIDKRLETVSLKIRQLEKGLRQLAATSSAVSGGKPPKASTQSNSGEIIEQEIKE